MTETSGIYQSPVHPDFGYYSALRLPSWRPIEVFFAGEQRKVSDLANPGSKGMKRIAILQIILMY
jgi:hypothetical protein